MEKGTLKKGTGTLKVHCHDKQGPHDKSHNTDYFADYRKVFPTLQLGSNYRASSAVDVEAAQDFVPLRHACFEST